MTRKTGFTLIELLVVIAIIAILAAIIFPVFMRAKDAAYRAGDMANLNAIRNALQLYRADQEAYPPQILGYASVYMSGPQTGQMIPANLMHFALYPKRVDSLETVRPAYDRVANNLVTRGTAIVGGVPVLVGKPGTGATWPNADSRPTGTAAILDLNGDGILDNATDDLPGARQAYGPSVYFCTNTPSCVTFATNTEDDAAPFYQISGYDVGNVQVAPSGSRWEIHYTLRWTNYAMGGGNRDDDPRQLIYSDPPDTTVITWDSWFREYGAGNLPTHIKRDYVLFLGGGARPFDSADIGNRSWRVMP
ncbi:MAG: type II secretion system protein [Fimbriimonadales bacterium]